MTDLKILAQLNTLRDESVDPARVDLSKAIRTGKKRRRNRRLAVGASATLAIAAVLSTASVVAHSASRLPAPPTVQPTPTATAISRCMVANLETPASSTLTTPRAVDSTGRYAAGEYFPAGSDHSRAVIWHDGHASPVDLPGVNDQLTAINAAGTAFGNSQRVTDGGAEFWAVVDGVATQLDGQPDAINDQGVIVGSKGLKPAKWQLPATTGTKLALPDPSWQAVAATVGNDGTIAGLAGPGSRVADKRIIVWRPDGSYQMLPLPDVESFESIHPIAVTADRVIARLRLGAPVQGQTVTVVYDLRTGTSAVHNPIAVSGSNRTGDVVWGSQATGTSKETVIWTASGGVVPLPQTATAATTVEAMALDVPVLVGTISGQPRMWRCR